MSLIETEKVKRQKVKDKIFYFLLFTFYINFCCGVFLSSTTLADTETTREYQVKAAFLYNFIQFVDWPEGRIADNNEPITIGIVGKNPFSNAFEPLKEKLAKGKKVVIRQFESFEGDVGSEKDSPELSERINMLRQCHLLFICSSEQGKIKQIINSLENNSVLTVADMKGFLELGGLLNFIMEDKKIRFEVNITAAEKVKLRIRSKLLRLAKRCIPDETTGQ